MKAVWFRHAWLGGESCAENVRLTITEERISNIEIGVQPLSSDQMISGVLLPGFINSHSHAFHRALRGRTHFGLGDFWSWRKLMYEVASHLTPDNYLRLATAVFSEMACAGITGVGEFHYIHHQKDGRTYNDPNEMGKVILEAARIAGVRVALLDVAYLHGSVDSTTVLPEQQRFSDKSIGSWLNRVATLKSDVPESTIGLAPHSIRAVHPQELKLIAEYRSDQIVHIHLSEQKKENEDCLRVTGKSPTRLLQEVGLLGERTTLVHATHVVEQDILLIGESRTNACFCPTTEADLADGIGPSTRLFKAGARLTLGTDSHAQIDMFAEAKQMEMHQRLLGVSRGNHRPSDLLEAATMNGATSLGWAGHGIGIGALADFISVSIDAIHLAPFDPILGTAHLVHCAMSSDVSDVWVGGKQIVAESKHLLVEDLAELMKSAIDAVLN